MDWPTLYYTVSKKELVPAEMPYEMPLLLSAASFVSQRKDGYYLNPPKQPLPKGAKGADCGGFVAALKWGGTYRFDPLQYISWLYTWNPSWAAIFDLPCIVPKLDQRGRLIRTYPGTEVVKERQRFTTQMTEKFWVRYRDLPWAWCPSIQGFYPSEYEAHARQLAPYIRAMYAYYNDPGRLIDFVEREDEWDGYPFRVGIGSLVGRAKIPFLLEIIERVQAVIGEDIPLHLWGVKLGTIKKGVNLPGVVSFDTGSWNGLFGPEEHAKRRASGLTEVEYSWREAYPDYHQRVQKAQSRNQQPVLFSIHDESCIDWGKYQKHPYEVVEALIEEEEEEALYSQLSLISAGGGMSI